MAGNVVLNKLAAAALRREFLGWQCRLRQLAVRQAGGRPLPGMCPQVSTRAAELLSSGIVTLIVESEPHDTTQQMRYQYLRTQDPNERYDSVLQFLQGSYFQDPARFADRLLALFGADSELAAQLVRAGECTLEFEQDAQCYRLPCEVGRLAAAHAAFQATVWHNRLFNHRLPQEVQVLSFQPDWPHAAGWHREP